MYSPENERKRNLVAIISIMVFVRVYARRLKQRAADDDQSEQYTERDLERLSTYTIHIVGNLIANGLGLHWVSIFLDYFRCLFRTNSVMNSDNTLYLTQVHLLVELIHVLYY